MKFEDKLLDYWGGDVDNLVEKIFIHLYKELPNVYSINFGVDVDVIIKRLKRKFNLTEEDFIIKNEEACKDDWLKIDYNNSDYLIKVGDRILLYISALKTEIYYSPEIDFNHVKEVVKVLRVKNKTKKDNRRSFFLLRGDSGYFSLEKITASDNDIVVDLFFNDDIIPFHQRLISFLQDRDRRGITLIYGQHGTGKTAYLKYLITNSDLKFIVVPRSLYSSLDSVRFYTYMRDFRDAVLILEDCDTLLSGGKYSPLVGFLQNAEGLLADNYNYKIICTTALSEHQINLRYIRKAKEILHYNMRPLSVEKANLLREKYGFTLDIKQEMVLEEVLNPTGQIFHSKKLGFNN